MPAPRKKIVSVDAQAARESVVGAGRKAKKAVAGKVSAGSKRARQQASRSGRSAVGKLSGKVAETRRSLERQVERRKNAAIRTALRTCVELSSKQLSALQKLQKSYAD